MTAGSRAMSGKPIVSLLHDPVPPSIPSVLKEPKTLNPSLMFQDLSPQAVGEMKNDVRIGFKVISIK